MPKVDFDKHADTYRESLNKCFAPFYGDDTFFDRYKIDCIKKWAAPKDGAYDFLDYGCGIGKITGPLAKEFPQSEVYSWDISMESVRGGREEYSGLKNVHFVDELPPEQKYDFIVVAMVFHHVAPEERAVAMSQIKKLLKSGGKVIIFEHNPLNPVTRHIVNNCPFDTDAKLILRNKFVKLAEGCGFEAVFKRYIVFFPWPAKFLRGLENLLRSVPMGAQYMLVLSKNKE